MEQRIVNIILRWMWLFVLATIGGGVAAYWYGIQQPTAYEASVRLIVGPGVDGLSPDLNDLRAGAQLMQTYRELATTRPILQAVIDDVGLDESPERLARRITVRDNAEAQVLTIFVRDEDPVRSAAIANSIANVLLRLSPSGGESPAALLMNQIRTQAATLEENIVTIEQRIVQLEEDLQAATTAQEQQLYIDQLAQERARLAESRSTLALLLDSLLNTPTNQVKIVEPAIIGIALSESMPLVVLVGSAAGLLLAAVAVFGYEYLDDTIKNADELEEATGLTVMGVVKLEDEELFGRPASLTVNYRPDPQTQEYHSDPESAEEYRKLATKLPLLGSANAVHAFVVSGLDEVIGTRGSNEIAANLAVVLAKTGLQVLFVDANLNHPTAHTQFELSTSRGGLTDLLHSRTSNPPLHTLSDIPGLNVLTSGQLTYDAFTELASPRIRELLDDLRDRVDVVVIAAPPLTVAASLLLASHVDGVLVIAQRGKSSHSSLEEAVSHLNAIGVRLIGLVLASRKGIIPEWLRNFGQVIAVGASRVRNGARNRLSDVRQSDRGASDVSGETAQDSRWTATVDGVRRNFSSKAGNMVGRSDHPNDRSGELGLEPGPISEDTELVATELDHDADDLEQATEDDNVDTTEEPVVAS